MNAKTHKKQKSNLEINGCSFVGVNYDSKAVNAVELIANGLIENAKALGALAQLLKASNVSIETMIKVMPEALQESTK